MEPMENSFSFVKSHQALALLEILEHIFTYLSASDLKTARLVSRYWRDSSKKAWRESAPVRLVGYTSLASSVPKFVDFLNSDGGQNLVTIYGNYSLSLKITNDELSIFQSFLDMCYSNLTVLDIDGCSFPHTNSLRKILFTSFPNMTHLSYSRSRVGESDKITAKPSINYGQSKFATINTLRRLRIDETIAQSGISWLEFFSHYPGLKILNIAIPRRIPSATMEHIFEAIGIIRQHDPTKLQF